MMNRPTLVTGTDTSVSASRLVSSFLGGRNERTARAYRGDLQSFCDFLGLSSLEDATRQLLSCAHGESNALGMEYRAHLIRAGLSPATVNRRLAALRSLVKRARMLGLIPWTLDVANVRAQAYRDTRGPGRNGFDRLLSIVESRKGRKALRDRAAIRLLFDLALRREEVVSLDIHDVNLDSNTVAVLGKGRTQRVQMSLPRPTQAALRDWLRVRGLEPGALFVNFDRARKGNRLTGRSLYRVVRDLGEEAGLRITPHGLRHAAITEALDLTGGDVRAVQRFSRHRDLRVLNIYDDSREDLAGKVAQLVATGRTKRRPRHQLLA